MISFYLRICLKNIFGFCGKNTQYLVIKVYKQKINPMKQVILIISLVIMALNVNAQQEFNSSDPNDYQYTVVITPIGTCSYGGGKSVYVNGTRYTVTRNSVYKSINGGFQYGDKTPIYQHTFQNYTDLTDTLPLILYKLAERQNGEKTDFEYRIDYTVMGKTNVKLFVTHNDWKKHRKLYKEFLEKDVETIKGDLLHYIAKNTSKLNCTFTYDMNGNTIYVDYNGNQYVWDIEKNQYVPAKMVEKIEL